MTIYHGGTVECDRYGYVEFVDMQSVPVLFNDRPSFSEMIARAREELHCLEDDDDGIAVEGVLHLNSPPNICLYVSSSSDLATLQGSPQKHMDIETPLGRGNGSKAFLIIRP